MSLRESILEEAGYEGDEEVQWALYLNGVRDGNSGQWGDEGTLLALSGVTGRSLITLSGEITEEPKIVEYAPQAAWSTLASSEPPIILLHNKDNHFTPVKVREGGEWGQRGGRGEDERMVIRRREGDAREIEGRNRPRIEEATESTLVTEENSRKNLKVRNFPQNQRPEVLLSGVLQPLDESHAMAVDVDGDEESLEGMFVLMELGESTRQVER